MTVFLQVSSETSRLLTREVLNVGSVPAGFVLTCFLSSSGLRKAELLPPAVWDEQPSTLPRQVLPAAGAGPPAAGGGGVSVLPPPGAVGGSHPSQTRLLP